MDTVWTWVAALLTLAIFSFLYKDNPIYKIAEHLFVGIAAGYVTAVEFHTVFVPNLWDPLRAGQDYWLLVPFALGLMMFSRFVGKIAWVSRWPIALMVGTYSGLAVIGFGSGDLVIQVRASMVPLISREAWGELVAAPGLFPFLYFLTNPLIALGLVSVLTYFFFSKEHEGTLGGIALVGTSFLMVGFGAGYGYTVMTRIALLIDRVYFLMHNWLPIVR